MQSAIIIMSCFIAIVIVWYVGLLDFFYPKKDVIVSDKKIVEWEEEKAACWTKH